MTNKNTLILIFAAGLVAGLSVFYLIQSERGLSSKQAGSAAMDFINKAIEQNNIKASLLNIKKESGVYKIHLEIDGQEYDSFISKDGKYLFSSAFNLWEDNAQTLEGNRLINSIKSAILKIINKINLWKK